MKLDILDTKWKCMSVWKSRETEDRTLDNITDDTRKNYKNSKKQLLTEILAKRCSIGHKRPDVTD